MNSLRSGIDELRTEDLNRVDGGVEADVEELEHIAAALRVEILRRVAEVDKRGSFRRNGYLSSTAWLACRLGLSRGPGQPVPQNGKRIEEDVDRPGGRRVG
jgi:hypothetical protein